MVFSKCSVLLLASETMVGGDRFVDEVFGEVDTDSVLGMHFIGGTAALPSSLRTRVLVALGWL